MSLICLLLLLTAPPQVNGPDAVVIQLYRDFACEAVIENPPCDGLLEKPRSVLELYLDDSLVAAILADRAEIKRTGESGRLDFLPIWDSQDPIGTTVKSIEAKGSSEVRVVIQHPDGATETLSFYGNRTKRGWRISDIRTSAWSLAKLLGSAPN